MLFCALCLIGYDTNRTPELAVTIVNGNAVCSSHWPEVRFNKDTEDAFKESARRVIEGEIFTRQMHHLPEAREMVDEYYEFTSKNPANTDIKRS